MKPTRILITGDRNWKCFALAHRILARLVARHGTALTIVHGSATGVDTAFHEAAMDHGVGIEPHPADWTAHGKAAGPRRNEAMVSAGAVLCLAVHRDLKASKGTLGCVRLALKAGIPVYLLDSEDGEPMRLLEV
jgi:hypothetical protein